MLRYLMSVKPLLSADEYEKMEDLVNTFRLKDGKKLQLYLKMKSWVSENYVWLSIPSPPSACSLFFLTLPFPSLPFLSPIFKVADWWEKYVYLRGRSPIVVNSNYYILDCGLPQPPTHVGACCVHSFWGQNKEIDDLFFPTLKIQVARAANIITLALDFKYLLDRELV